ncbi:GL18319 [Drosophila persimilis]|uniref:GL18319 n=1 Tax=Drosophila persimilis TaxID=7234 RepID=B4H4T7_DROPE|nr:GL18319 [Drosophila persimilis]
MDMEMPEPSGTGSDHLRGAPDEESSAEGKAGKDEQGPRRGSTKKNGNPKNVTSEEKQRPTDVRESQKSINEMNARKVLKSNGGEGQLEAEKRKEDAIRWGRKRRESEEIKRKESNDIENREEQHQRRATEKLERKELEKKSSKEPEKREVPKDRGIVKKRSCEEWIVKEGAPEGCTDEDTILHESRSATEGDMEEEQMDRRREMQWDLLLKVLQSEKFKRRRQSQETVDYRNALKTKEEPERKPSRYDTLEEAQQRKELRRRESEERRKREQMELADANEKRARKDLEKRASLRLHEEAIKREKEECERKELEKQKLMIESQIMKACPWQQWPSLGALKKIFIEEMTSAATGPQTVEEKDNRREGGRATQWDIPLKKRQSKEKNPQHQSQEPDNSRKEVEEKDGLKLRTWPEQAVREQREEELRAPEKQKQKIESQDLRREETKETKRREGTEKKSKEELRLQPVQDRGSHEVREKLRQSKEIQIKRSTDLERVSRKEKTECENPGNVRLHKELSRIEKLKNYIEKKEVERKSSEKKLERELREQERILKEEGQKNSEKKQVKWKENQIKTKEQPEKRAKEPDRAREPEDEELRLRQELKMMEYGKKSCLNVREEPTGRATKEELEREQEPNDDRMRNGKETEGLPREALKRKEEKERKEEKPKIIASGYKLDREQRGRARAQQEERQKREGTSVGDTETSTDVPDQVQGMSCPQKKTCVMEQQQDAEEVEQQSKNTQMVSPPVSYCTRNGRKRFRPKLASYQLNRRKGLSRHQERHVFCPILSGKGEANEDPEALCRRLQTDNALMERKIAEARRRNRGKHIAVSMMSGAANVVRLFQLGRRTQEPKPEETRWTEHFGDLPQDFDLPTSTLRKIIHSESQRAVELPGRIFQTISKALHSRGGQLTGSLLKCIDTMDASLEEHLRSVLNSQFEAWHVPDLLQMAAELEDEERNTATSSLAESCRATKESHQQHWKQLSDHFISLTQASFSDHCDVEDDLVQAAFQTVVKSYTAWSSRRLKNVARDN